MSKPRLLAFYLPQYHPIPENDLWWGKDFTDWTNVVKGKPRFWRHYQPHIPSDLGYYDLRDEEVRFAQASLAEYYGLTGFCYYHYWFNEKMLLEKPFNEVLESGKPDFPFCLCWANENWTRRWDGLENEILIEQNYSEYSAEKHFEWLEKAFSDKRYIRIFEKPLFLIYNIDAIPNIEKKIKVWRDIAKTKGFPGIYICSVKSVHNKLSDAEVIKLGFDALVDFFPNGKTDLNRKVFNLPRYYLNSIINKIINLLRMKKKINLLPLTWVFDYKALVRNIMKKNASEFKTFPCVIPGWDNSARKRYSMVVQNDNASLYSDWLQDSIQKVQVYPDDEQIVFVNAWNEWAEGCHLEPDQRNGRKFLEATLKALQNFKK